MKQITLSLLILSLSLFAEPVQQEVKSDSFSSFVKEQEKFKQPMSDFEKFQAQQNQSFQSFQTQQKPQSTQR